ncbi:hypothetical protein FF38_06074 [Lucilia cuprina]|uniref:Uncharacterized protein n=1 Tax=Lucilia cuprina TaxID=7375 RepID=A0A0L0CPH0_LUCCU|nr:hypothetical protein CVS40_3155 [Lucilia cuprina]KNC33329.1 hypothetical protein FF38_06074 [Lucilia cuprina]
MKVCFLITISFTLSVCVLALPLKKAYEDSPISTIVIPYEPYSTHLLKDSRGKMQRVYVPDKMDIVPRANIKDGEIAMGSQKGMALNFAEGAYPVYYMPGNANGKFQDRKIYLLEEAQR